jgi:hypothetical protein
MESPIANPRGIPAAPFPSDIESYLATLPDAPVAEKVATTLSSYQELLSKYQFMELSTTRRLAGLREKIPEVGKTLEAVRFLGQKGEATEDDDEDSGAEGQEGETEAWFELQDTLYAKAEIPQRPETVALWLGVCAPVSLDLY